MAALRSLAAGIDEAMSVIRRDFVPPDLKKEIGEAGIDGVVSVRRSLRLSSSCFVCSEFAAVFGVAKRYTASKSRSVATVRTGPVLGFARD
jgi:hypothetical protein